MCVWVSGRAVEIKGSSHTDSSLFTVMALLLLIIPSVLSPLSADTSSWCFSPRRLPVFDNKIAPAASVGSVSKENTVQVAHN